MNKKLLQLSLFFFIMVPVISVYAQSDFRDGFIVTNDGDTIPGKVDYRSDIRNAQFCSFKKNDNARETKYQPFGIKSYRFSNDRFYQSHEVNVGDSIAKKVFLEVLAKGNMSLYYFRDENQVDHYYVKKNTTEFVALTNTKIDYVKNGRVLYERYDNKYIGLLKYLMTDCDKISKKIEAASFGHEDLLKLVDTYNQCTFSESETFEDSEEKTRLRVGAIVGLNSSSLHFSSNSGGFDHLINGEFGPEQNLTFGLFLNIVLKRVNEKLSFQGELLYNSAKYRSQSTGKEIIFNTEYDVTFDLTYLEIPTILRYTYPKGTVRPYLNAGISNSIAIKKDNFMVKKSKLGNDITVTESDAISSMRNHRLAFLGGAGADFHLSQKRILNIEIRFTRGSKMSNLLHLGSKSHTFSVLTGINF